MDSNKLIDIVRLKELYSEEINKYKTYSNSSKNIQLSRVYHDLLKSYSSILQKEKQLENEESMNNDIINTPIEIKIIKSRKKRG